GLQLDRPLAHRWRCFRVAAGDRRPVALHHLVGDATPQHRPALVHEAGEEGVCLVVSDSFLVVDATVQGDVDTEGQESHGVLRSRYATSPSPSGSKGTSPSREVLPLCRLTSYMRTVQGYAFEIRLAGRYSHAGAQAPSAT